MYASAVDNATVRLRELRFEEWGNLSLGVTALGLAAAAAETHRPLALPLFVAGFVAWTLGVRALWRRWDLVDRLADDRDAYAIPDVLAYASREATMDRRKSSAGLIRSIVGQPGAALAARVDAAAGELEALASELEDETLELNPSSAVACLRLLSDLRSSPLLNPALPPEDLRLRVFQIRSGISAHRIAV